MNNVLDLADQGIFLSDRATGATALMQCVWVYNRAIEVDGLRQFHHHLQRGPLARAIERSPLPFGRHRWVSPERPPGLEIVATPRPREEFDGWLNEKAGTPLDAEHGPGWHLAVLPFTDGGTGVSLVVSHCIVDGLGLSEALVDAACGRDSAISWPAPGSRRRWQALREDARQTARDTVAMGRAGVATVRLARLNRAPSASATALPPSRAPLRAGRTERLTLPTATTFIDAGKWDDCAHALGGTGNALLAGLAGRLAQRMGRVGADGSVVLAMPVSDRAGGDTRANAVTNTDITIYPELAATDLRGIRVAIRQALKRQAEGPDERWALMPLIPLLPQWLARRMVGVASGGPTTVVASNLGELDPAISGPDGTPADYYAMQSLFPSVTKETVHRAGGRVGLASGRVRGQIFVSVLAYQPSGHNSDDELREKLSRTLSEFSLTGTAGW